MNVSVSATTGADAVGVLMTGSGLSVTVDGKNDQQEDMSINWPNVGCFKARRDV